MKQKNWRTDKESIGKLVELMNSESLFPMPPGDELSAVFDAVLNTEQIDFLLQMGGGNHTLESLKDKIDLPEKKFKKILESLLFKGPIVIIKDEAGNDVYHIMSIYPGWFELYLKRGVKNKESKNFAKRIEDFLMSTYKMGNRDMINQVMKDFKPFFEVYTAKPVKEITVTVDKEIDSYENVVFSTKHFLSIFEELDDNEDISIANCFCRFEKELIGDSCRTKLPMETCISIGQAAKHMVNQGMARSITKKEAISKIKVFQDQGAVHQSTLTMPLKDFQGKYPGDYFCSCCWDCCGVMGSYNRGYMPYNIKSNQIAKIISENCTGCEVCVEYCPVSAISMNPSNIAVITDELCIGCGLCYHHCAYDAVELLNDERTVFLPMLEPSQARIEPPKLEDDSSDLDYYITATSEKTEVIAVLEEYRQKFLIEDNIKGFEKWNKSFQWYYTDLDEYWNFTLTNGKAGELKEGQIDNPDISYTLSGAVFIGLMRGTIDPMKAMRKKLTKADASMRDLMKLGKIADQMKS